jgi:ABC-type lipoprotein release transport system permease subunit
MKGEVSEIALMTHDRNNLGGLLATLRAEWPKDDVAPWTDVEPLLVLTETISDVFMFIWFAIVFVAMSFGLVNTLLMAIFERTREMGLLQALGMAPKAILAQVLFESLFLLMLGLVLGNLLAFANLWWLSDGLDLTAFAEGFEMIGVSPVIIPRLELKDWLSANVLVAVLGVLASLYPAYRAARINPREAMTRI